MTLQRRRQASRPRGFTAHERDRVVSWQIQHDIAVLDDQSAKMALRLFVQHGCNPVQVLELLRVYSLGHSDTFTIAAWRAEKQQEKVMRVARLLRRAARELRQLAILPELPEGKPDVVDDILEAANYLENYLVITDWGDAYKKEFGGTLVYLVLASKLVLLRTGNAHFKQLTELLKPILQKHQLKRSVLTPDAFRRQVARFDQRYPEVREELADLPDKDETLEKYMEHWLAAWKAVEASVKRKVQLPHRTLS